MNSINENIMVSADFKKHSIRAIFGIVLFILVYLVFATLSLILTVFLLKIALSLFTSSPSLGTIILGLALSSFGLIISFFLIKFIFSSSKTDRSDMIEIDYASEPELMAMIEDIVAKVQTHFPKHIYLSNDVNAAVFYDSTFWSMFFPIKKNLIIGIGLVNTVSQEELKAVLAHEFGHFSQKTMKVGSYVYNVNRVIYNMLFENDSFNKLISNWSSIHIVISIIVWMASLIIRLMQWILKMVYSVINKAHSGLSIEMEYHADEVAAIVTGSLPLSESLLRMDLANHSLAQVLRFYQREIVNNNKSENVYPEQKWIMDFYAHNDKVPFKNGNPIVTIDFLNRFNQSKLVIKDQWASHPATEDRVNRLMALNIPNPQPLPEPANFLFRNLSSYQNTFTEQYFTGVEYNETVTKLSIASFIEKFKIYFSKSSFDLSYNSYYDNKNMEVFELESLDGTSLKTLETLYSNEMVNKVYLLNALTLDTQSINLINDKKNGIKTFDYDGVKYQRRDCLDLKFQLDKELTVIKKEVLENDKDIFQYFLSLERKLNRSPRLQSMYQSFFEMDKRYDSMEQEFTEMNDALQFINYSEDVNAIRQNFVGLEGKEMIIKSYIQELIAYPLIQDDLDADIKESFDLYLNKKLDYFYVDRYIDENLQILFNALNNYNYILSRYYFLLKKEILDYQISLKNANNTIEN